MVDLAARADNVLVDRQKSECKPGVKEAQVFASSDEARASLSSTEGVVLIENKKPPPDFMQSAYDERLKNMKTCDETDHIAPCKIGDIIVEASAEPPKTEVWQQQ
jgi:hypothetical protein